MDISQRITTASKPPNKNGGVWIIVILILGLLVTGGVLYWKHGADATPTVVALPPTPPKTALQVCEDQRSELQVQKAQLETELAALKQELTSVRQVSPVPPKKVIVIKKPETTPKDPSNVPQPQPWSSTPVPSSVLKWLQHDS